MRRFGQFLLITLVQGILFLVPTGARSPWCTARGATRRAPVAPSSRYAQAAAGGSRGRDARWRTCWPSRRSPRALPDRGADPGRHATGSAGRALRLEQADPVPRARDTSWVRGAMGSFPGLNPERAAGARPGRDRRRLGLRPDRRAPPPGNSARLPADAPTPTSGSVRIVVRPPG